MVSEAESKREQRYNKRRGCTSVERGRTTHVFLDIAR